MIRGGDTIVSRRHCGPILVDVAGSKVLLGRKVKQNGEPGLREVVVSRVDVVLVRHSLPGMGGVAC